ncbi:gluconate 2-dehydrogenase subunit 3 family protein [Arachidicoccus terrestris]|uniref:gluconate 2-dehydrogenase subunit 3 family protein n=1 Tax=Arachidicoccus terrestris TaxID=2875539 RepID=UPI001CC7C579|nr:gluconate 2-dehydrogenase subunit 3 family protein [Arachidicoccus terrestris]UAY57077.1 gluconate 2-dehydrogenase subunit 3 family protein [Arachidicoccus terrestris]
MQRREALRNVALLVGGGIVLSGTTMSVLFDSCSSPKKKAGALVTEDQQKVITEVADIIIPTTSCPGAKAAGVGPFVTLMMKDCYPEDVQKDFVKGLEAFIKDAKSELGKDFLKASRAEQEKAVASLREKTIAKKKQDDKDPNNTIKIDVPTAGSFVKTAADTSKKKNHYFFELTRDLTIMGYFSSEIGATQARAYVAVPGHYDGCVDLKPGQKAWA